MLPFGVTIPATVPQGSEIPEGLMNNPVYIYIRPAAFSCRDFFLLHDNALARKDASVCQFLTPPQKSYNPLLPPVLSRFISARIFYVPQVGNEVKRTPICGCCWDPRSWNWWIKEGTKKRNFLQVFRKCTTAQKLMDLILNKRDVSSSCVLYFLKKKNQSLKFGQPCVYDIYLVLILFSSCNSLQRMQVQFFR